MFLKKKVELKLQNASIANSKQNNFLLCYLIL